MYNIGDKIIFLPKMNFFQNIIYKLKKFFGKKDMRFVVTKKYGNSVEIHPYNYVDEGE